MDKDNREGSANRGLRLSVLNTAMIVVAVLAAAGLLYATHYAIAGYDSLKLTTERYISCQQAAASFQSASDYLTNESRSFVVTGDPVYARGYVEEVETARRREQAIDVIDGYMEEKPALEKLNLAMEYSGELAEVEYYAMCLVADTVELAPGELPEVVASVELTPEDAALSDADKRTRAIELLYGEEYQALKAQIVECVDNSINVLISDTRDQQIASSERLTLLLRRQQALIALLLVMVFAAVACTYALVIRPLNRSVAHIREHREMPVSGAREMRFLAYTYNDMFAQHEKSTEKLTYSATHDSLTGVYNRTAYDAQLREIDRASVGVLIIDVDKFKGFNDNYGHDVGDRVLQRVARIITESFRSEDFISRIGGDEFCVIMRNANSQMRDLVQGKIDRANHRLQNPEDDLPPISLSVGVAFGDREKPTEDIFKDADTALYSVKRSGGGGCAFY